MSNSVCVSGEGHCWSQAEREVWRNVLAWSQGSVLERGTGRAPGLSAKLQLHPSRYLTLDLLITLSLPL